MLQGPRLVVAAATDENSPRLGQGFDTRPVDESLESLESLENHSGSAGSVSEFTECSVEDCDAPATGSEFQVGVNVVGCFVSSLLFSCYVYDVLTVYGCTTCDERIDRMAQ